MIFCTLVKKKIKEPCDLKKDFNVEHKFKPFKFEL